MKTIKILGTGCPNCKRTETVVKTVVEELKMKVKIVKIEDIQDIMRYDVMSTPAVVINEKVVIKGKVPSFDEIKSLLKETYHYCSDASSYCCEPTYNQDSCCNSEDPTSCC